MLCPFSSFSTMLEVLFFLGRIVSIVLQNFLGLFWFLFNSSFMNSDLAWLIALFARALHEFTINVGILAPFSLSC